MHRLSVLLPAARGHARAVTTACVLRSCCYAIFESFLPLQGIVVDRIRCSRWSSHGASRSAKPGYAAATATVPAFDTLSRAPCASCLSTRTTAATCPAISFAHFCVRLALAVRLPYRVVPAELARSIPHPQVRSIGRSVSGLMQRSQLRLLKGCVQAFWNS